MNHKEENIKLANQADKLFELLGEFFTFHTFESTVVFLVCCRIVGEILATKSTKSDEDAMKLVSKLVLISKNRTIDTFKEFTEELKP